MRENYEQIQPMPDFPLMRILGTQEEQNNHLCPECGTEMGHCDMCAGESCPKCGDGCPPFTMSGGDKEN